MAADDWVARARRLFPGLGASQHFLSNVDVGEAETSPEGLPSVRCRAYVRAEHVLVVSAGRDDAGVGEAGVGDAGILNAGVGDAENVFTIGGYYDDRLVRTDDRWQITAVALHVLWTTGDRRVLTSAAERAVGET